MAILTFPTIRPPSGASYRLRGNTQTHVSPFDGTVQTLEMQGAVWELSLTWESLNSDDQRVLAAFLAALRGRAERIRYSPISWAPRRATGGGSPTISGAGQTGSTLSTAGWSASAQVMRAGDWLSYADTSGRTRLHMVTADTSANGSGLAALPITPPIRRSGNSGAAVSVTQPSGIFILSDDAAPEMSVRPPMRGALSLTMVEALA